MSINRHVMVECDASDCISKYPINLVRLESGDTLPPRWMRVKANSLEFVLEMAEYDFCSTACYLSTMSEIDELLREYEEHSNRIYS